MSRVHFHNILMGKSVCLLGSSAHEPKTIDPDQVTCPECLRWLGRPARRPDGEPERCDG